MTSDTEIVQRHADEGRLDALAPRSYIINRPIEFTSERVERLTLRAL